MQGSAREPGQQCGKLCKLDRSSYEEQPDVLSGPCGCIVQQDSCSAEFSGGVVQDICRRMGDKEFSKLYKESVEVPEETDERRRRSLQSLRTPALRLLASAE